MGQEKGVNQNRQKWLSYGLEIHGHHLPAKNLLSKDRAWDMADYRGMEQKSMGS